MLISSDGNVILATFLSTKHGIFTMRAWNLKSSQCFAHFAASVGLTGGNACVIGAPALSCDGRILAFYSQESGSGIPSIVVGELCWSNQPQFSVHWSWRCDDGGVLAQFSKDGNYIARSDKQHLLNLRDVVTGHEVAQAVDNSWPGFRAAHGGSKPSVVSPICPGFTSTGVIGSWNSAGRSRAVLLSSHSKSYRATHLDRLPQFCYWLAAKLAGEQTIFSKLLTHLRSSESSVGIRPNRPDVQM